MTTHPRVTVGLWFYGAATTIADAIRSVFAQTPRDWELILLMTVRSTIHSESRAG